MNIIARLFLPLLCVLLPQVCYGEFPEVHRLCLEFIYGISARPTVRLGDYKEVARLLGIHRRTVLRVAAVPPGVERFRKAYSIGTLIIRSPNFFASLSRNLNDIRFDPNLPIYHRVFRPRYWPGIGYLFSSREAALASALRESGVFVSRSEFDELMEIVDTLPVPSNTSDANALRDRANRICVARAKANFKRVESDFRTFLLRKGIREEEVCEEVLIQDMQALTQVFLDGMENSPLVYLMLTEITGLVTGPSVQHMRNHSPTEERKRIINVLIDRMLDANGVGGSVMRPLYRNLLQDAFFGMRAEQAAAIAPERLRDAFAVAIQKEVGAVVDEVLAEPHKNFEDSDSEDPDHSADPPPPPPPSGTRRLDGGSNYRTPGTRPFRVRSKPSGATVQESDSDSGVIRPPRPLQSFQIAYLRRGTWRGLLRNPRGVRFRDYVQACDSLFETGRYNNGHYVYQTPFHDVPVFVFGHPRNTDVPVSYAMNLRRMITRILLEFPEVDIPPENW